VSRRTNWTVAPTGAGQRVMLVAAAIALVALMGSSSGRVATGETIPVSQAKRTAVTCRIDPNTATVGQLICLPSIGPVRAKSILVGRDSGAYRSANDLCRIHGIGPGTVRTIARYLIFRPIQDAR
jgi:DNA uptake protein ComE-like DNA-binding protein